MYWLLLTGEVPSDSELKDLQRSLVQENTLPESTRTLIETHSKIHHPMTVLSMAILDLQKNSKFFKAYSQGGLKKSDFWVHTYDDALDCLKVLPQVASLIYTEKYNKSPLKVTNSDWAGSFS